MKRITSIRIVCAIAVVCSVCRAEDAAVRVGVLEPEGASVCRERWQPLVSLLDEQLPVYRFRLVPLGPGQVVDAVRAREVDLLITSPTLFVHASVAAENIFRMATVLRAQPDGGVTARRGGVLFCRICKDKRSVLDAFKHSTVLAEGEHSLAGWLAVERELKKEYAHPADKLFDSVQFGGSPAEIITAVNAGKVQFGVVPSGIFEELSATGQVNPDEYNFFSFTDQETEFISSTPLYPDWIICAGKHVPDEAVIAVLQLLWGLPADAPAFEAAGIAGFGLPQDYSSVRKCLQELKYGPFADLQRRFRPHEKMFWVWYKKRIIVFSVIIIGLLTTLLAVIRLNRRLVKARDEAFAADKAKSAFLANMSHEIRTPLNAILGLSDLLKDSGLEVQQQDYANTIHSSSNALLAIINDILDLSKIDANKLNLEHSEFDLRECIESAVEVIATGAQKKGLAVICAFDPDMPVNVLGDYTRLRQVLLNLLGNAIKFTEHGEIELRTVAERRSDQLYSIEIHVRDTGIGMTRAQIARIFTPFNQADTSTTRKFGGTGLGLSISRKIIDLMGGELIVESVSGEGSEFIVTVTMPMGSAAERTYLQECIPGLCDRRALIVDANWTRTEAMAAQLEYWGMAVHAADSKTRAIDVLETEQPFDLILVDSRLADLYGTDLCAELRSVPRSMDVPLVLLAGSEDALAGSFDGIIHKPPKLQTLQDRLVRIVEGESADDNQVSEKAADPSLPEGDKDIQILVVDDLQVNLKVAQKMCHRLGYEDVDLASSGAAALEALELKNYDVVLMDVQMPEMDGLEVTRRILDPQRQGQVPVVIGMTANAMLEDREKCYEAGMSDYVPKPVQLSKLGEALSRIRHDFGEFS